MNNPAARRGPQPIESIQEAAFELGVSERTVYRMLRSGKLYRVKTRSVTVDDNCQSVGQNVSKSLQSNLMAPDSVSDKMSKQTNTDVAQEIALLKSAAAQKDAQIATLLETQRELQQTIQRLQEQMFELARLVLSQKEAPPPNVPAPQAPPENRPPWHTWLPLWPRRSAKPGADNDS